MIYDYRYNPWEDVLEIHNISGERHTIPTSSPYTIRLNEVPQKTDPTSLSVVVNGQVFTEVAATPEQGQFFPDYRADVSGDANWNRGSLLFNAADAGKTVVVSYRGMGTLNDARLQDQLQIPFSSSQVPERHILVNDLPSYDWAYESNSPNNKTETGHRYHMYQHRGIPAGTYSLREILQKLINMSHTQNYAKETYYYNCNCDCSDDSGGP